MHYKFLYDDDDDYYYCFFQSTSTSVLSGLAGRTAGKLFGLFSSEKDKIPSTLIIPVDDTLRQDVFPVVDCSPGDNEVEVTHIRGVTKCRKHGQMRGTVNSDSSDMTSGRRSSPESGYRTVADGVWSTPAASSDVSNDSLASTSSGPSSVVTSPHASEPCLAATGQTESSDMPIGVQFQPTEFRNEMPSIVTRTAAEDELIRSIFEEHYKSLCAPAVSDDVMSLSADALKSVSTNTDVSSLNVGVCEIGPPASQCITVVKTTPEQFGGTGIPEEEEKLGESEDIVPVDETVPAVCDPSAVEDEISIYDDSRLAVQQCAVRETTDEAVARFNDSGSDAKEHPGCSQSISPLLLTDTESLTSDTKLSRTSSVSSALSLESLAHSAEVR